MASSTAMRDRDRDRVAEGRRAREDQDAEDRLRRVGDGRERVRREDGERLDIRQPLVDRVLGGDRATDEGAADFAEGAARLHQLLARDEVIGRDLLQHLILRAQDADILIARQGALPHLAEVYLGRCAPPCGGTLRRARSGR